MDINNWIMEWLLHAAWEASEGSYNPYVQGCRRRQEEQQEQKPTSRPIHTYEANGVHYEVFDKE